MESFIRQSLDKLEVQPGISSFEMAMKKLEAAQKEEKKKRFFIWFFAGIAFCGLSTLAFFIPGTNAYKEAANHTARPEKISTVKQNSSIGEPDMPAGRENKKALFSGTDKASPNRIASDPIKNLTQRKRYTPLVPQDIILVLPSTGIFVPDTARTSAGTIEETAENRILAMSKNPLVSLPDNIADTLLKNAGLVLNELPGKKEEIPPGPDFVWYAGGAFDLQWTNYSLSTKHMDNKYKPHYDTYFRDRLHQNEPVWNYNASLSGGFSYKGKWIFLAGFGYQTFQYEETISRMDSVPGSPPPPPPLVTTSPGNNGFSSSGAYTYSTEYSTFANTLRYVRLSMEGARIFRLKNFGVQAGMRCFAARSLPSSILTYQDVNAYTYSSGYNGDPLSKWMYGAGLHLGVCKDIGSRFRLQAGPNAFYYLSPVFRKGYIVHQKPYGLGFEFSLMIRLN